MQFSFESKRSGDFFAGLDLAQTRDYCVLAVLERVNDKLFLRHLKIFQQPTLYATVLGYVKLLQDRWGGFAKIRVDFTREGPSIIKDMEFAGIENAEGVNFSVPRKSEMASLLKQRMAQPETVLPVAELGEALSRRHMHRTQRRTLRTEKRRRHRLFSPRRNSRRRFLGNRARLLLNR